jgi:hypothetical protein
MKTKRKIMTLAKRSEDFYVYLSSLFAASSKGLGLQLYEGSSTDLRSIELSKSNETNANLLVEFDIDPEQPIACMIASEKILGEDWNTPEEDEAWADL